MSHYTHLSLLERRQLYIFLEMGWSITAIAQRLGRNRSTVYRELARNQTEKIYLPGLTQEKAKQRIRQNRQGKLQRNIWLYDYVVRHLKEGWSPEQIAGRMKREEKKYYACAETIYQYIYHPNNKGLYQYLANKKPKRRRHHARKSQRCRYSKNGRLRRYLPRNTDIHSIDQQHLDRLAEKMNNVPRKCLGFKKPNELFLQYKRNLYRTWS